MLGLALAVVLSALAPTPATVVHETRWFRGSQPAARLLITEDVSGHCVSSARSSPRADAWRWVAERPAGRADAEAPRGVAAAGTRVCAVGDLDGQRQAVRDRGLGRLAAARRPARAVRVRDQRVPRRLREHERPAVDDRLRPAVR